MSEQAEIEGRPWHIRIVILALVAIGVAWIVADMSLPTYRYRLVVVVDTPQGVQMGSSVIEVRSHKEPRLLPDMSGLSTRIIGEAAAVDLPGGQTLFATLARDGTAGDDIGMDALVPVAERNTRTHAELIRRLLATTRPAIAPRNAYPLMVRIRDVNQPGTIEGVDPNDLAASFGPGVRLRGIVIQRVDKEPTFSLQRRLPWIEGQIDQLARASNGVGIVLHSEDFQRR